MEVWKQQWKVRQKEMQKSPKSKGPTAFIKLVLYLGKALFLNKCITKSGCLLQQVHYAVNSVTREYKGILN